MIVHLRFEDGRVQRHVEYIDYATGLGRLPDR